MKSNCSQTGIARRAVGRAARSRFQHRAVIAHQEANPAERGNAPSLLLGQVVRPPQYGEGIVVEIEVDTVKVRFQEGGDKTFRRTEAGYSFELTNVVEPVEPQSLVEKVLARETKTERKERELRCKHGQIRTLCLNCAELTNKEEKIWSEYRSRERHIKRDGLGRYIPVKISKIDCTLASRSTKTVPASQISDWYECRGCGRIHEVPASKGELDKCPHCRDAVTLVAEPFQSAQFSREIGSGARWKDYGDARPGPKHSNLEEATFARVLFLDGISRVQAGGTGYLRIPLDEPRSTREDAPEWIDCREQWLRTLSPSRADRAERILAGFYVEDKADSQIAQTLDWKKDSVKKERRSLVSEGSGFFRSLAAEHPPSPAVGGRGERHLNARPGHAKLPVSAAIEAEPPATCRQAIPLISTDLVAICSPERMVLRRYPVFDVGGEHYAKWDGRFQHIADLRGLMRVERASPRARNDRESGSEPVTISRAVCKPA